MSAVGDAVIWLNDPLNWRGPEGVPQLGLEQLAITAFALGVGAAVALPVAFVLGHTRRGGGFVVAVSNTSRAVPTFALLVLFAATAIGFGNRATAIALVFFAIPPLLANAYTGVRNVDADVVESARGMGMSGGQVLRRVEVPLALPLVAAGLRTAAVQVVATAPLAALVGGGTLGLVITNGWGTQRYGQVLAGGVLVVALALLVDGLLFLLERAVAAQVRGTRRRVVEPADAVSEL